MTHEQEFILNCCKYLEPKHDVLLELSEKRLDYIYILGQLLYNRVGGTAYYVLEKSPVINKLNREFKNTLKTIYETNKVKNESFKHSLNFLGGILSGARFKYALLKGSYLQSLYPSGLRTSNDIDILISFKNITEISKILLVNGFVQGYIRNNEIVPATRTQIVSSQMNRGETVPFIKEVDYPYMRFFEIDLNFSLDFKPEKGHSAVESFLDNAVPDIHTENGDLYTLAKDDFLIQLCTHLYKEAATYNWVEFGRDQGLYKYLDIYLFTEMFKNAVNCEKINALGLEKECFYALDGTNRLFDLNIPLDGINVYDTSYIKHIKNIANKKTFAYDMDFVEWVFCSRKGEMLHEITV